MTLGKAKSIARHLGLTLRMVRSGNYRVNFRDGNETTAYYTDNLEDAINAVVAMARKRAFSSDCRADRTRTGRARLVMTAAHSSGSDDEFGEYWRHGITHSRTTSATKPNTSTTTMPKPQSRKRNLPGATGRDLSSAPNSSAGADDQLTNAGACRYNAVDRNQRPMSNARRNVAQRVGDGQPPRRDQALPENADRSVLASIGLPVRSDTVSWQILSC